MLNSESFSTQLRERLRKKYGRLPAASFVAIHFNRFNKSERPISQETARRWMRGVSMPSYLNLLALSSWLAFDFNEIFAGQALESIASVVPQKVEYSVETIRCAELLSSLPTDTQALLFNLMSNLHVASS